MGMSTTYETEIAKHAGMKVFGMSLITNMVSLAEDCDVNCTHEEVLQSGAARAEVMKAFVTKLLEKL